MTSAICIISMTENTCFVTYLLINLLLAGSVQPFFIRWAWMPEGWIVKGRLNDIRVHFRDYAGSGIVHVVGGLSAAAAIAARGEAALCCELRQF
ncbi:hypothetical protein M0802_008817 [Mischocyttarus mexicanus]|nr:hypothetical protein M0802_008817 [Mischocyttarus mexicanus]